MLKVVQGLEPQSIAHLQRVVTQPGGPPQCVFRHNHPPATTAQAAALSSVCSDATNGVRSAPTEPRSHYGPVMLIAGLCNVRSLLHRLVNWLPVKEAAGSPQVKQVGPPILLEEGDGPLQADQRRQEGIEVSARACPDPPLHLHVRELT